MQYFIGLSHLFYKMSTYGFYKLSFVFYCLSGLYIHSGSNLLVIWSKSVSQSVSSVTQLGPTLCDPMNCSTPGLPVHHQLLESTQTHVHWVGDAIQPSHPLLSPSPPALNPPLASGSFQMSQLFASGGQSIGVSASASVLPMNTQDWSPLGWTGWISLQSKGPSRVFSNTTVQKHQFSGAQLSLESNSHIIHDHWKNHSPFSLFVAYHFTIFNNAFRWILNSYFNTIKFVKYLF